jgi:polyhydroxyalkanoate synthesis regulator phasin
MGREDRRIIYNELEAAYDSPETGYKPGWSDQKIATSLGTPAAWVKEVREEMFGTIATNSEMNEFLKEATEMLKQSHKELDEAIAIREQIKKMVDAPGFAVSSQLIERISKIERLATAVRKLVVEG